MPGMYADGDFDLTGFARGAVDKGLLLPDKAQIVPGDVVIAITSSAINSSSFGIVRRILEKAGVTYESPAPFDKNMSIKDSVLLPNKVHVRSVFPLMKKKYVKAAAYTNEGGMSSIRTILPPSKKAILDVAQWTVPPIFKWIAEQGNFSQGEMIENFNCGLDMFLIVGKNSQTTVLESLTMSGENAVVVGTVKACDKG